MTLNAFMTNRSIRIRINFDFLMLVGITIFVNLPYLINYIVLPTDTSAYYNIFQFVYESFFYQHALPQWIPYGTYGMSSSFYFIGWLSPLDNLLIVLGGLFRINNFYFLFTASQVGKQLIQLMGLYLLARELFDNRYTVLFVCVSVVGSYIWIVNLYFSLYFTYLLPLTLYFLVLFFKRRDILYLWCVGISMVIWGTGSLYLQATTIFTIFVIFLALFLLYKCNWKPLIQKFFTKRSLLVLILLLFLVIAYGAVLLESFNNLEFSNNRYRDTTTGLVNVNTILKPTGDMAITDLFQRMVGLNIPPAKPSHNVGEYVGLLPLILFVYALKRERNIYFWAIFCGLFFTFWLSRLGIFTRVMIYIYPLLRTAHYLEWNDTFLKFLLVFCAGYGFDSILKSDFHCVSNKSIGRLLAQKKNWLFFVILVLFSVDMYIWMRDWSLRLIANRVMVYLVLLIALDFIDYTKNRVDWAWFHNPELKPRLLAIILLFGVAFDNISFQVSFWKNLPQVPLTSQIWNTFPLQYQAERKENPVSDLQIQRLSMPMYHFTYQYAQFDPCNPYGFYNKAVMFYDKRLSSFFDVLSMESTPLYNHLIGCNTPKLRFAQNLVFVTSEKQAIEVLKKQPKTISVDVIELSANLVDNNSSELQNKDPDMAGDIIEISHFDSDSIQAKVNVTNRLGAWLIYSDVYHPGWSAMVDGSEQKIMKANLAFKALWVPNGEHVIKFSFKNSIMITIFFYSMALLSLALLICFFLQFFVFIRRKSTNESIADPAPAFPR